MLSRSTVTMCIYGGSKVQIKISVRETSRSLAFNFHHSFCFIGAILVAFSTIATVWEFGRAWLLLQRVSFAVNSGRFTIDHGVEYYCWSVTVVAVL